VIVVQVDLNFGEARLTQKAQRVEVFPPVLLGREEERMAGWPAVGVPKWRCEPRQLSHPYPDASALDVETRRAVCGFEMVGDTEQDVGRRVDRWVLSPAL